MTEKMCSAYLKAIAPAWEAYQRARDRATKAYKARDEAYAAYVKVCEEAEDE